MNKQIENGEIDYDSVGTDEQHVAVAPDQDKAIDDALELQPISIRLQKSLLDNLKSLAQLNGIGYQPLVRQILTRWVDSELKQVLRERLAQEQAQAKAATKAVATAQAEQPPFQMAA